MQKNVRGEAGAVLVVVLVFTAILAGAALIWALSLDEEREKLGENAATHKDAREMAESRESTLKERLAEKEGEVREQLSRLSVLTRERDRLDRRFEKLESDLTRERSLRLAALATARLETDPVLALKLAHEAVLLEATGAANTALLTTLLADRSIAEFSGAVSFVVSHSGDLIALRDQKEILIVDARSGQVLFRRESKNKEARMAFSPDDRHLVAVFSVVKATIIDIAEMKERATTEVDSVITSIAFSPDGSAVLYGTTDRAAWLFDLEKGERKAVYTGHEAAVTKALFTDAGTVATFGSDNVLRFFDAKSGDKLREIPNTGLAHRTEVLHAPAAGKLLLIDLGNRQVDVVDAELGEVDFSAPIGDHHALDDQGRKLLFLADKQTIRALDLKGEGEPEDFHKVESGSISGLAANSFLLSSGTRVTRHPIPAQVMVSPATEVAAAGPSGAREHDLEPGGALFWKSKRGLGLLTPKGEQREFALGGREAMNYAMAATGERVVLLTKNDTVLIFSVAHEPVDLFAKVRKQVTPYRGAWMQVSHDGSLLLLGDPAGAGRIFSTRTGEEVRQIGDEKTVLINAVFSRSGKFLLCAQAQRVNEGESKGEDGDQTTASTTARSNLFGVKTEPPELVLVDLESGEAVARTGVGSLSRLTSTELAFDISPDDQLVAYANENGVVVRTLKDESMKASAWSWRANRQIEFTRSGHEVFVGGGAPMLLHAFNAEVKQSIDTAKVCQESAISHDDRAIITLEIDGSLRSWSVETGKIVEYFGGPDDPIVRFACSPTSGLLAAVGGDGSCRIYDLTKKHATRRWLPEGEIRDLAFSDDGEYLILSYARDEGFAVLRSSDQVTILRLPDAETTSLRIPAGSEFVFHLDREGRLRRTPLDAMKLAVGRELPRLNEEERRAFQLEPVPVEPEPER